jgi:hypothetical protein
MIHRGGYQVVLEGGGLFLVRCRRGRRRRWERRCGGGSRANRGARGPRERLV